MPAQWSEARPSKDIASAKSTEKQPAGATDSKPYASGLIDDVSGGHTLVPPPIVEEPTRSFPPFGDPRD